MISNNVIIFGLGTVGVDHINNCKENSLLLFEFPLGKFKPGELITKDDLKNYKLKISYYSYDSILYTIKILKYLKTITNNERMFRIRDNVFDFTRCKNNDSINSVICWHKKLLDQYCYPLAC